MLPITLSYLYLDLCVNIGTIIHPTVKFKPFFALHFLKLFDILWHEGILFKLKPYIPLNISSSFYFKTHILSRLH